LIKFFNSKNRDTLIEYFKFKEKNGYKFSKEELDLFILNLKNKILLINNNNKFSNVFVPETSNTNLIRLAQEISNNIIFIEKNNKNFIINELNKQQFQKKEKEALLLSLSENSTVKMADIKGNQRKRFIDFLFKKTSGKEIDYSNSLFLDDSSFSSYTYKAAINKIQKTTFEIILFFKE
jgi:hypothetical protein